MGDTQLVVVSATVVTEDPNHATKAAEVLARAGAGLLLDGIQVNISMGIPTVEDEEADAG